MVRRLSLKILLISVGILLNAPSAFSAPKPQGKESVNRILVDEFPVDSLISAERISEGISPDRIFDRRLGFDGRYSLSPGLQVGATTFDAQSYGRMNRQVDWRNTQDVHFVWTRQTNLGVGGDRGTTYNCWDADYGELAYGSEGCDIHPRLGQGENYSGYVGLDIDTEGKAVIGNHHYDEGDDNVPTIWYDFLPGSCFFSPYKSKIPDSIMQWVEDLDGEYIYAWPSIEYQVWNYDTVTHVFAQQQKDKIQPQKIVYFRRIGSDTLGYWDYPPMVVDTIMQISQTVTASRQSSKVALVWLANLPAIPGGTESVNHFSQVSNDLYYMMSSDMGSYWGPKNNVTDSDSSQAGWRAHTDLSCLFDSDDYLHIIWNAREYSPYPAPSGSFPHAYGSRLFHWDEYHNEIRVIKDANWDLPAQDYCHGGAWNQMSIGKMQISECDSKLYAVFVQFNDIRNGISDDCHENAFTGGQPSGAANGELYIAISDNRGYTWDIARNLTNTYTPHCYEDDSAGYPVCESDHWPSMSRYGMQVTTGNFYDAEVVDPSGYYTGDYYLDVLYINDKYPGSALHDAHFWTDNEVKWFRLPCIEPEPSPMLATIPLSIGYPAWTKPGVQLDTTIRLENVGNDGLHISSITVVEENGPSGWLAVGNSGPISISEFSPNYYDLDVYLNYGGIATTGPQNLNGYLLIQSDSYGGSEDTFYVDLYIDDTTQTIGAPFNFSQVDFVFDSLNIPNSSWGRLNVNISSLIDSVRQDTGFINVYTMPYDSAGSGWVIKNMLIISVLDSIATYFDLTVPEGTELIQLPAYISYTPGPLETFGPGPMADFPVTSFLYNAEGLGDSAVIEIGPPPPICTYGGLTEPYKIFIKPFFDINEQCAMSQCAPMSAANSLEYLEQMYGLPVPHPHVPGIFGDGSLVGQLDMHMNRTNQAGTGPATPTDGRGVSPAQMIQGKLDYLSAAGLAGNVISNAQFGNISFDWIEEELEKCEDVELGFYYEDAAGNIRGGHAIRVFGCGEVGGSPFVLYLHDAAQTNIDAGNCGGLEWVFSWTSDMDGDGMLNLHNQYQEIAFAYSESADMDGDEVPDGIDNCPDDPNPDQTNSDNDSHGDICDNCPHHDNEDQEDTDGDGVGDICDNCPDDDNPGQEDRDNDAVGDVCDNCPDDINPDQQNSDTDSHGDVCDNCPNIANEDQQNSDTDSHGDVCDNCPDDDNENQQNNDPDSHGDACDNCPNDNNENQQNSDTDVHGDVCDNCPDDNNDDQLNSDADTFGDVCDNCPYVDNQDQVDDDVDGVGTVCDNCPVDFNPMQEDSDLDGIGDSCDTEIEYDPGNANGDAATNILDITYLIAFLYKGGEPPIPHAVGSGDPNCDCIVNILDITYLIAFLYKDGPAPCTSEQWQTNCDSALKK